MTVAQLIIELQKMNPTMLVAVETDCCTLDYATVEKVMLVSDQDFYDASVPRPGAIEKRRGTFVAIR